MYRGPGVVKRSPKKPRHEGICLNQKDGSIFYQGSFFVGAAGCAIPLSIVTNPPASGSSTPIACFGPDSSTYNLLPAGLEGAAFAPLGTPGLYLQFVNSGSASGSTLNLYKFQWSGSSGTLVGPTSISVPEFHEACGGGACVPQYGTKELLDSLGDRLMYRLSYLAPPTIRWWSTRISLTSTSSGWLIFAAASGVRRCQLLRSHIYRKLSHRSGAKCLRPLGGARSSS